ncbi:MAG TPA: hypothetical protein V6C72_07130 [Chroococcales cyanobacterium]
MKGLFLKLYDILTEPLYRRLSREMSLQAQSLTKAQLDYQERTATKIMDELLRLNMIVQHELGRGDQELGTGLPGELVPDYNNLSSAEIETIVRDIDKTMGAIELAHKHQLPLSVILDIKSKFKGMRLSSIERTRHLESEKQELLKTVSEMSEENQRLRKSL